ncbi:hypothetical protein V6N13_048092 [Hibiscus sabdariffa]|uniref:Uncharacterized protein n=1 Tax=Hibiscus sabdariffa TaxID=183260 RepID=A0ABR2F648_9ROSI
MESLAMASVHFWLSSPLSVLVSSFLHWRQLLSYAYVVEMSADIETVILFHSLLNVVMGSHSLWNTKILWWKWVATFA